MTRFDRSGIGVAGALCGLAVAFLPWPGWNTPFGAKTAPNGGPYPSSRMVDLPARDPGPTAPSSSAAPPAAGALTTYTITDLGELAGGAGKGLAINQSGQVLPGSMGSPPARSPRSVRGRNWQPRDLNDHSQVVGQAMTKAGVYHAFLSADGAVRDLGTLGADPSEARAINDVGQIAGVSATDGDGSHAFLYSDRGMRDLGTLGGTDSEPNALNAMGQVVGSSSTAGGETHAFLWYDGVMRDLGTLGGTWSEAKAINDAGQVVGSSTTAAGQTHAFLWSDGKMHVLGSLDGELSQALGINNQGQVVGWSTRSPGGAFLYAGGAMIPLHARVPARSEWVLAAAYRINDAGQIVGRGMRNGRAHGFLLTPEPLRRHDSGAKKLAGCSGISQPANRAAAKASSPIAARDGRTQS